jgi:beta-lactamase class A
LDSLGFIATRVNSRTPGREAWRSQYGWGQTSPREMANLVEKIYKGDVISKAASERMLRCLNRNFWDEVSISQIPPYATVFSKNGAVNESRSEVVLVRGIKSNYVFCISTKNNKDTSWTPQNKAWVMTRKISNLLWNYFEPKDAWSPAPAAAKLN